MTQEKKPKKTLNVLPDRMKALPRLAAEDPPPPAKPAEGMMDETAALRCDRCDQFYLYAGKLWIDGDEVDVKLCGKCYVAAGNPSGLRKVDPPVQSPAQREEVAPVSEPRSRSDILTIQDNANGVVFSVDQEGNVKFSVDGKPAEARVSADLAKAFSDGLRVMADIATSYLPESLIKETILVLRKDPDKIIPGEQMDKEENDRQHGWNDALDAIEQTLFPKP